MSTQATKNDKAVDEAEIRQLADNWARAIRTKNIGEETDVWVRATVCYRKKDGKWRVAHEHVSVPFYMDGSYKAAVDLQP